MLNSTLTQPKFQIGQTVYDRYWLLDDEICDPEDLEPGDDAVHITTVGIVTGLWFDAPDNMPGWSYHLHWHTRIENSVPSPCTLTGLDHESRLSDL